MSVESNEFRAMMESEGPRAYYGDLYGSKRRNANPIVSADCGHRVNSNETINYKGFVIYLDCYNNKEE